MSPAILLDDTALTINFDLLGDSWQRKTAQSGVYNGTVSVWTPDNSGALSVPPELELFFYGSDINVYGTVSNGVAANYTIDETTLRPVNFPTGLPDGKTGVNLFSLPGLTESLSHNFQLFPSKGQLIIDYVTYTPNTDTLLTGLDLVLDDPDAPLQYSDGQWNHTTGDFVAGRPYNGTMSGSRTPGATMKLSFEGSDISVYGLLNQVAGQLSASFSVDGQTPTIFNPFNGSQTANASSWKLSQQFFHQDLAPGSHNLLVTLTNVTGDQTLWIDSVVYEATDQTTLAGASSSGSGGGGTSGINSVDNSFGPTFPKPAIAGIVAGAFILAFILFIYARRLCATPRPTIITPPPPIPPPPPLYPPTSPPLWTPPMHPPPMNEPNWNQNWHQQPMHMNQIPPIMPVPVPVSIPTMHDQDGANGPALRSTTDMDGANPDERAASPAAIPVNRPHEDGRD